jgi:hypothetical protein
MARIPTSDPQAPARTGSVGVQTDINIGSNVFAAIKGAAGEFGRLQQEAQGSIDRTAGYKTANAIDDLDRIIEADIKTKGIENDPSAWPESIEQSVEGWNTRYEGEYKGASPEAIEQFNFQRERAIARSKAKFVGQAGAQMSQNERAAAKSRADRLVENGDLESATAIIDSSPEFTDAEKTIHKDNLRSEHANNIRKAEADRQQFAAEFSSEAIESATIRNNLEALSDEEEMANSKSGIYADMDENSLSNAKNKIFSAKQGVIYKQNNAFGSFMQDIARTGVINDLEFNEAIRQNLLTEEHQEAIRASAPDQLKRIETLNRFKEDKVKVSFRSVSDEIDEEFIQKFATGSNTSIGENELREKVEEIDRNPDLGTVAKNTLKGRLMIATSQAVLEDDNVLGTQVGEAWGDMSDEGRKFVSEFAREASDIISKSLKGKMQLWEADESGAIRLSGDVPISDVFIDDLNELAAEILAGKDPSKSVGDRLSFYRTGFQQVAIRQALSGVGEIEE